MLSSPAFATECGGKEVGEQRKGREVTMLTIAPSPWAARCQGGGARRGKALRVPRSAGYTRPRPARPTACGARRMRCNPSTSAASSLTARSISRCCQSPCETSACCAIARRPNPESPQPSPPPGGRGVVVHRYPRPRRQLKADGLADPDSPARDQRNFTLLNPSIILLFTSCRVLWLACVIIFRILGLSCPQHPYF